MLHTIAGGLDGGLSGALGALASSKAAPTINNMLLGTDKTANPSSWAYLLAGVTAAGIGYAAGGISGAGAATNQIYNNDFVDFETHKVIRAKCAAGTTNAAGLPCVAGVVDHFTTNVVDPTTGQIGDVAYFTPGYLPNYNPDETVEVSVPIYSQNGVAGSVPTATAPATLAPSGNPGVDALLSNPSVWLSNSNLLEFGAAIVKNAAQGAVLSLLQTAYMAGDIALQIASCAPGNLCMPTAVTTPSSIQFKNSMQKDFGAALLTGITLGAGGEATGISLVEDAGTVKTVVTGTDVVANVPVSTAESGSTIGTSSASQALANLGYTENGIYHIFQEKHLLDPLVSQFGSQENALLAMQDVTQQAVSAETYQTGSWFSIKVGGIPVTVKGAFVNGIFRISTATMRPFR